MSVLLQISDPHFGTEQAPVVAALLELAGQLQPDVALFSGDITQRARRAQWRGAETFAKRLPAKQVLAIPGNHDIPLFNVFARAFAPYAGYASAFGRALEPELDLPDMLVLCLNTTRPRRHKDGEVSMEQIDRVCSRLLRARREQLRIVVTHQPVHVIRPNDECNLLHGAELAVRRWIDAGADLLIGGHIHLPYVRPLSERYPGLPRRGWCVQAGTALSHRVRGSIPNSVNIVRHDAALTCTVERWDFSLTRLQFEPVETHALALERATAATRTEEQEVANQFATSVQG
ncbi:MAG TPA: metallophosphoesterase [Steroidobacteraceae bacterium]|nr:metallophosphoesterase [Steroidobacteraceae bacterium]